MIGQVERAKRLYAALAPHYDSETRYIAGIRKLAIDALDLTVAFLPLKNAHLCLLLAQLSFPDRHLLPLGAVLILSSRFPVSLAALAAAV